MLTTHDLSLSLGNRLTLDRINLAFHPRKCTAIIGPNGAGKTSLMRCLSGEIASVRDQVSFDGQHLSQFNARTLAYMRSVLPQSLRLDFPLSVAEIIEMAYPYPPSRQQLLQDLKRFQSEAFMDDNYLQLSGGERQRVQLARVLAQLFQGKKHLPAGRSQYLLLDECTSALDPAHQQQTLVQIMQSMDQLKYGAVMIFHDLALVAQYASDVVLLKAGSVFKQGSVSEVLVDSVMSEAYECRMRIIKHPDGWPLVVAG